MNTLFIDTLFIDEKLILEGDLGTYDINRISLYKTNNTFRYTIGGGQTVNSTTGRYTITDDTLTLHYTHDDPEENNTDKYGIHKDSTIAEPYYTLITKYKLIEEQVEHHAGHYNIISNYTVILSNHPEYGELSDKDIKRSKYHYYLSQYNTTCNISKNEIILNIHNDSVQNLLDYSEDDIKHDLLTHLSNDIIIAYNEYLDSGSHDSPISCSLLLGLTSNYIYINLSIGSCRYAVFYKDHIDISMPDPSNNYQQKTTSLDYVKDREIIDTMLCSERLLPSDNNKPVDMDFVLGVRKFIGSTD